MYSMHWTRRHEKSLAKQPILACFQDRPFLDDLACTSKISRQMMSTDMGAVPVR